MKQVFRKRTARWVLLLAATALLMPRPGQAQNGTSMLLIGNQGNFSDANGSVTLYDAFAGQVQQDVVPGLGTLVQSIFRLGSDAYIMANTSDRIDIFDPFTLTRVGQILDVPGPRYMAFVEQPAKAYVTNLAFGGPGTVTVIDLNAGVPTGTIEVGSGPEGIATNAGRAYVANFDFGQETTITVIDVAGDHVTETKDVGCDGPRFITVDHQDEVWVFCTGKTEYNDDFTQIINQTNGEVVVYDAAIDNELARFPLDAQIGGSAGALGQDVHFDPVSERATVLAGHTVLTFDTSANAPMASVEVPGLEMTGSVAYDGNDARFYVGRVTSFTEAGFVSVLDAGGAEVARFDTGIIPASIVLLQGIVEDVEEVTIPDGFRLSQNYPNPFNPSTTIDYAVHRPTHVTLKVYNVLGEEVATLVDSMRPAGAHQATWNAADAPSGTYLYRLQAGALTLTKALTLVR